MQCRDGVCDTSFVIMSWTPFEIKKEEFSNYFSPNGDGVNDVFRPAYKNEFNTYRLQVYNRWGELVFVSSSPKNGWDSVYKDAAQPMGVYIYKLEYAFYDEPVKLISGNVTLIR